MGRDKGVFHRNLKCECNRPGCRICYSRNYSRRKAAEHQANPVNNVVFRRRTRTKRVDFAGLVTTRPVGSLNQHTEAASRQRREDFFERRRQYWEGRIAEVLA